MRPLASIVLAGSLMVGVVPSAAAQPVAGTCAEGSAQKDLDANNVRARMFNVGNLFWKGDPAVYNVPSSGNVSSIFSSGVWVGGYTGDELRVAAATYSDFEYWPGPLDETGNAPTDCSEFDRIYKVGISDITAAEEGTAFAPDLRDWPVELGAPTYAAPNNGFDDDGDGLVDEGTDLIDNDGDGLIDERDEIERIDPEARLAEGLSVYDFAAGDRPEIIGTQTTWWVMNDAGNVHVSTGSRPVGMEVQAQSFAFARADALNDVTFYRWKMIYKGTEPLERAFLTIYSDVDLGDYTDDYIGSDSTRGIGFVYNADNEDDSGEVPSYGTPPPALGYDFFKGAVIFDESGVATDTLGMTRFGYYNNGADPVNAQEFYNLMSGRWQDGIPWTEGGNGRGGTEPVNFVYPGFPGEYWSEFNIDGNGTPNTPADRRFLLSTGPFTMQPGEVQEIVFGVVWALGTDNINSVEAMFNADVLAQTAYGIDFELAEPPPSPTVTVIELDNQVVLDFSSYETDYEEFDRLLGGQGLADSTYNFEGFNIYRYQSANDPTPERIATFDVVSFDVNGDPIGRIIDQEPDPATGELNFFVAAEGDNSGLQKYYVVPDQLANYRDYFYGVSAYGYSAESVPKVLESQIAFVTVRPEQLSNGSAIQALPSDVPVFTRTSGLGVAQVTARVVNPLAIVPGNYEIQYFAYEDTLSESTINLYDVFVAGELAFDGEEFYEQFGRTPDDGEVVVAGISLPYVVTPVVPAADSDGIRDFAGDGRGIGEVSTGSGEVCPDGIIDPGCANYNQNTTFLSPVADTLVVGEDSTFFQTYSANSTDAQGQYFILPRTGTDRNSMTQDFRAAVPDDFELRFTENCATNTCYAVYPTNFAGDGTVVRVPFEAWNLGKLSDEADDYRMIPILRRTGDASISNFANTFPSEAPVFQPDGSPIATTEAIYMMVPDRENGYEAFASQAAAFGVGNIWDPENDGDDQNPEDCSNGNYYIDYCYLGTGNRVYPVGNFKIADAAGDGTTPEVGTVIRFLTVPKPNITATDVLQLDATSIAFIQGDAESRSVDISAINVVPNPYRGASAYELTNSDRVARFINLPPSATIRVFTLSGNLIRTLISSGETSLDWDLQTQNGLPISSGMYLVFVEGRDASGAKVGEKVIKFGVVQRSATFSNF